MEVSNSLLQAFFRCLLKLSWFMTPHVSLVLWSPQGSLNYLPMQGLVLGLAHRRSERKTRKFYLVNALFAYFPSYHILSVSSVAQSCLTLCNPRTAAHQASLSITNSRSLLKLMSIELVMPSNHLTVCRSLHLPLSIFPSIRVFSNESVLHIR